MFLLFDVFYKCEYFHINVSVANDDWLDGSNRLSHPCRDRFVDERPSLRTKTSPCIRKHVMLLIGNSSIYNSGIQLYLVRLADFQTEVNPNMVGKIAMMK